MVWSPWELIAVLTGLGFLLLAVRENPWCWVSGGISVSIFLGLFWQAELYMQSLLQLYYLGMSVYGWRHWRHGKSGGDTADIVRFSAREHLLALTVVGALGLTTGLVVDRQTAATLPYLDSFTTWGSVVTTWMAARKVLENWLYWIVIDTAAIALYSASALYLTTGLFVIYLLLAVVGLLKWRRSYRDQSA